MISYSFFTTNSSYPSTMEEVKELLKTTDKEIRFTYGLKYRNPTIYEVPISKEEAIEKFNSYSMIDVIEKDNWIDMNQYSANDML